MGLVFEEENHTKEPLPVTSIEFFSGRPVLNQENSKGSDKEERRNSPIDRRSGKDRRKAYKLGYFKDGGVERRSGKEQRSEEDRRSANPEEKDGAGITGEHQNEEES